MIGENGAGKTTLIKSILNIINIDDGKIKIFDKDNKKYDAEIKEDIGVLLDNIGYYGFRVEDNQLVLYVNVPDASSPDVDNQAPPFTLEGNNLYFTIGGTIQYVSKETI